MGASGIDHPLGPRDVDVGVTGRLGQRRPHTGQSGQVHHHIGPPPAKRPFQRRWVAQIAFAERELRLAAQRAQVGLLHGARIKRVEVVEADHLVASRAEPLGEMGTDEPGRAGQKNEHGRRQ